MRSIIEPTAYNGGKPIYVKMTNSPSATTCSLDGPYVGQYLSDCVSGDDCQHYGSQDEAEAACIAAGNACGGILTEDSGNWQIRASSTPTGTTSETSYVKVCPVQASEDTPAYLYYVQKQVLWMIGPNYMSNKPHAFALVDATCPRDVARWHAFSNNTWTQMSNVSVVTEELANGEQTHMLWDPTLREWVPDHGVNFTHDEDFEHE